MFGFGSFSHILVILVLALILIGPKQLPEVARTLGRLLSELRRASNTFQDQINNQMRDFDRPNSDWASRNHQNENTLTQSESSPQAIKPDTEEQLELTPQNTTESDSKSDEKKS